MLEANLLGGILTHSDYDCFLNREPKLDAMLMPTQLPLHAEMGIKTTEAGDNVMLEEPYALTLQDIDRLES